MDNKVDANSEFEAFDFAIAVRAFELMTLSEKRLALEGMASLRYPSVTDRFFQGVYQVVMSQQKDSK